MIIFSIRDTPNWAVERLGYAVSWLADCRPLVVVGKGAAQSYADSIIRQFVDKVQIPVLSTSMGRGVLPDNHPLSVIAARSMALAKADVVLVMGARYANPTTKHPPLGGLVLPAGCHWQTPKKQHGICLNHVLFTAHWLCCSKPLLSKACL